MLMKGLNLIHKLYYAHVRPSSATAAQNRVSSARLRSQHGLYYCSSARGLKRPVAQPRAPPSRVSGHNLGLG